MTDPQVSICLTAYRRAHAISKTIESLLAQDFGDFELIIADDASPDDTEEVCRRYERLDGRIRYYRNEQNLKMPGNLNGGLRRCRAPLVANLHDGDIYRSDLLRRWKAGLDRHVDAAFAFCALAGEGGSEVGIRNPDLPERLERDELLRFMLSDRQCFGSPVWGTVMGRRAIYESVGLFDERFSFYSDVWMWMRLNHVHPVVYVNEPLIKLTPHEPDRPYASLNWWFERIILTMYEDAAELLNEGDPVAAARDRQRLRGLRDRRWFRQVGHAIKIGAFEKAEQGLQICRAEGGLALWVFSYAGVPLLWAARSAPGFRRFVQVMDRLFRGGGA